MSEKTTDIICNNCWLPFIKHKGKKSCDCNFETIEVQLREMRNDAYRNKEYDNKNRERESGTYKPDFGKTSLGYWKM